jgi:hypothetical protein
MNIQVLLATMAVNTKKSTPIQVRIPNTQIPNLDKVAQDLAIPQSELIRRGILREMESLGRTQKTT